MSGFEFQIFIENIFLLFGGKTVTEVRVLTTHSLVDFQGLRTKISPQG